MIDAKMKTKGEGNRKEVGERRKEKMERAREENKWCVQMGDGKEGRK